MWSWGDEEVLVTRWTYKHYDGSSCRYDRDKGLWLIKRLPPLAGHSSRPEWIGAPCRYCNDGLGVVVYQSKPPERTSVKLPYLKERWWNYVLLVIFTILWIAGFIFILTSPDLPAVLLFVISALGMMLNALALLRYDKWKKKK